MAAAWAGVCSGGDGGGRRGRPYPRPGHQPPASLGAQAPCCHRPCGSRQRRGRHSWWRTRPCTLRSPRRPPRCRPRCSLQCRRLRPRSCCWGRRRGPWAAPWLAALPQKPVTAPPTTATTGPDTSTTPCSCPPRPTNSSSSRKRGRGSTYVRHAAGSKGKSVGYLQAAPAAVGVEATADVATATATVTGGATATARLCLVPLCSTWASPPTAHRSNLC